MKHSYLFQNANQDLMVFLKFLCTISSFLLQKTQIVAMITRYFKIRYTITVKYIAVSFGRSTEQITNMIIL